MWLFSWGVDVLVLEEFTDKNVHCLITMTTVCFGYWEMAAPINKKDLRQEGRHLSKCNTPLSIYSTLPLHVFPQNSAHISNGKRKQWPGRPGQAPSMHRHPQLSYQLPSARPHYKKCLKTRRFLREEVEEKEEDEEEEEEEEEVSCSVVSSSWAGPVLCEKDFGVGGRGGLNLHAPPHPTHPTQNTELMQLWGSSPALQTVTSKTTTPHYLLLHNIYISLIRSNGRVWIGHKGSPSKSVLV